MNAADVLAGGARLVRTQPKAVAIWGLLYLVVCIALMAVVRPMFADLMMMQQQAIAARAAGLPPPPPPGGVGAIFGAIFGLEAILFVVFAAIFAAAVRATALGGHDRFAFLRAGMDEVRLLGLGVLLLLFGVILTLAVAVGAGIAGAALGALAAPSEGAVVAITIGMVIAIYAVLIWALVRISLAGAYTVLRGRIVVREAWRATRGRYWTLFGVYLLIGIVYFAVTIVLVGVANPGLLSAYGGGMQSDAMQAALAQQQATFSDPFSPRLLATWVVGAVIMAVVVGFTFGAIAAAAIGFDQAERGES